MTLRLRPLIPDPDRPGVLRVPLSQGRFALVDEADAERVGKHNWTFVRPPTGRKCQLVQTKIDWTNIHLHWFILGLKAKEQGIIFENTNPLDCRRSNMRVIPLDKAFRLKNSAQVKDTKTREKNVHQVSKTKYCTKFKIGDRNIYIGGFKTIHEAAEARDKAKIEYGY